jgi:hypothetical protein
MLVIKIEMWPRGDASKARLLGEGRICNEGGDMKTGNYSVNLLKSPEYAKDGNVGKSWRKGTVSGFPRQKLGPWDLLLRGLVSAIGSRNPGATFDAAVLCDVEIE